MTLKILDIDLDFFLNNKYCGEVTSKKRLDGKDYIPWDREKVENFLEKNCGLKKEKKTPGKCFIHHDEVFFYLRELQEKNNFNLNFSIDHLDAHCDLGLGDSSYVYISTSILNEPIKNRAYPDKINGWQGLSAGNFLAFAIACRWVIKLNYINNSEWIDDIQQFYLQRFNSVRYEFMLKKFTFRLMKK